MMRLPAAACTQILSISREDAALQAEVGERDEVRRCSPPPLHRPPLLSGRAPRRRRCLEAPPRPGCPCPDPLIVHPPQVDRLAAQKKPQVRRRQGSLAALSGAGGMSYVELQRTTMQQQERAQKNKRLFHKLRS